MKVDSTICLTVKVIGCCCLGLKLLGMSKCVKCRTSERLGGDTWCLGCSAWELIGKELTNRWSGAPGLRAIADNLVLNAAREVRALRALGAGSGRAPKDPGAELPAAKEPGTGGAGTARAPPGVTPKSQARPRDEPEEAYSYTYETDTEEEAEDKKEKAAGSKEATKKSRAEEEEEEPPLKRVKAEDRSEDKREERKPRHEEKEKRGRERSKGRERHREVETEAPGGEGTKKKKKKKNKRAGRNHKRLARLAENPYTPVHRGLPDSYLASRPLNDDRKDRRTRWDGCGRRGESGRN